MNFETITMNLIKFKIINVNMNKTEKLLSSKRC